VNTTYPLITYTYNYCKHVQTRETKLSGTNSWCGVSRHFH